MIPTGKGIFIWPMTASELAGPEATAYELRQAGFTHAILRITDGMYPDGVTPGRDLVDEYAVALRRAGLKVWGFAAVYGNYPDQEADAGIKRFLDLGLEGFVVDAEGAYKTKRAQAIHYMDQLRRRLAGVPIALSSFRWPSYHPEFPWSEFMERCDFAMPQVYWEQAHNAGAQLERCLKEYGQRWPGKQIFPTGAAYQWQGWRPTPAEIREFFAGCQAARLSGCNFWEYGHSKRYDLWATVAALDWEGDPLPPPDPEPGPAMGRIANQRSDRVNLRSRAAVSVETVMGQLRNDVQVEILERIQDGENEWLRVRVEGVIAKRYRGQVLVRE